GVPSKPRASLPSDVRYCAPGCQQPALARRQPAGRITHSWPGGTADHGGWTAMPPHRRRLTLALRALPLCALLALAVALPNSAPAHASAQAQSARAGARIATRIVSLARKELSHGVHEIPDGSNRAPAIYRYDLATTPHYYGAPWCAYFVSYVARQAGVPIGPSGRGLGYVPYIRTWAHA